MRKLTPENIKFVLDKFDDDGWFYDYNDLDIEQLQQINSTGNLKYKFDYGTNRFGYLALGVLNQYLVSRKYSKLLNTHIIALVG